MGGIHSDIQGKHPGGALCGWGNGMRVDQRRQPPGLELRHRVAGLRYTGRSCGSRVCPGAAGPGNEPVAQLLSDEQRRIEEHFLKKTGAGNASRRSVRKCSERWSTGQASIATRLTCGRRARLAKPPRALREHHAGRPQPGLQHRADDGAGARFHADVAEAVAHSAMLRRESRGAHTAPTSPKETMSISSSTR